MRGRATDHLRLLRDAGLRACRTRGWAAGLCAAGAIVLLGAAGGLRFLDRPLHDAQLRWFGAPDPAAPSHVACFEIDDGTLARTGWPLKRTLLAGAIGELDRAGARVIALDLLLDSPQGVEWRPGGKPGDPPVATPHDENLAAACRQSGKVVLGAQVEPAPVWDAAQAFALRLLLEQPLLGEDALVLRLEKAHLPPDSVRDRLPSLKREALLRRLRDWRSDHSTSETLRAPAPPDACTWSILHAGPPAFAFERAWLEELWTEENARDAGAEKSRLDGPPHAAGCRVKPPIAPLAQTATVGAAPWSPDADGVVRSCLVAVPLDGTETRYHPTLPVAVALRLDDIKFPHLGRDALTIPSAAQVPLLAPRFGERWLLPGPRAFVDWTSPPPSRQPLGPVVELARLDDDARHDDRVADLALLAAATRPGAKVPLELLGDEGLGAILDLAEADPASADHPDTVARRADLRDRIAKALAASDADPGPAWRGAAAEAEACRQAAARFRGQLRRACEGKVCLVGWTATGSLADFVTTPLGARVPGMRVQAAMIETILAGTTPRRAPFAAEAALALALALALAGAAWRRSQTLSLAALALALAGIFLGAGFLTARGLWFDAAMPMAAAAAGWFTATLARLSRDNAQKRRITAQFRNYVSPALVDHLVAHPDLAEMRNEKRELTCVFTDFAGFTSVGSRLDADATARLLNRYLAAATEAFMAHGGNVNKYMGDGILVFWGAPVANPRQATDACRALCACRAALAELAHDPELAGLPTLFLRAGMTTGEAMVGDFGAPPLRSDYTVIGDSVNLASRLESANKHLGTATLLGQRTAKLAEGEFLLRPIARLKVVGRDTPEPVFELLCPKAEATDDARAARARSAAVADAFVAGDFARCAVLAQKALAEEPGAKWAGLYLAACAAHLADPSLPHDGSLALEKK